MKQFKEKLYKDKIPFHQNMIGLYFRKAFQDYQKYMSNGWFHTYHDGNKLTICKDNPFEFYKKQLMIRLGNFSHIDQWYWDVLHDLNMRGKTFPAILEEIKTIDPDKEAWIKQQINDPKGIFTEPKKLYFI